MEGGAGGGGAVRRGEARVARETEARGVSGSARARGAGGAALRAGPKAEVSQLTRARVGGAGLLRGEDKR